MDVRTSFLDKLGKVKPFFSVGILLLLLALAFAYAMFQGGFVSWFIFYSFLPFALYSILLFLYPMKYKVERTIPTDTYRAGDSMEVTLTLTRKFRFPLLFLLVEDDVPSTFPGNRYRHKQLFFPGLQRRVEAVYTIEQLPRGEHTFQQVRLKTGDALGLMEKEKHIVCEQKVLVYPIGADVYFRTFRKMLDQGGIISQAFLQNDISLVSGIREYEPGDRFSWIDWKASARSNGIMTKEFEARQSNDLLIVLDLAPSKAFELLVRFAVSASKAVIEKGGNAGLFMVGKEKIFVPPQRGLKQEQSILYQLARVMPDSPAPLEKYFGEQELAGQPGVIVIITSSLSKRMVDDISRVLNNKGQLVICLVKTKDEKLTSEEMATAVSARGKGIVIHIADEQNIQPPFEEVKQA